MVHRAVATAREAMQSGRPDAALAAAREALAANPHDIDALEIVALVAQSRRDVAGAETTLRQIIAIAPNARWARDDLARLLIDAGRPAEAEAVAREAIVADPDHADAQAMLGTFLSGREALVEGAWHLRRALGLAGRHPQLLANLSRNLMRQGELEEAAALADEAARLTPQDLTTAMLRAEIAEQQGNLSAAAEMLDRAEPVARRAGTDILLARATLLSRGPDWREGLAMLDRLPELSGAARLLRGRLRDRAERHDEAWEDFVVGKAMLARPYDHALVERHFAELAQAFTVQHPVARRRTDVPQPIFLLGFPRSGTTMAEQMLASHSAIRAGGELPFTAELRDFTQRALGFPAGLGALATADQHHWPALLRDFYLARAETYGLTRGGAAFFTDKMPLNDAYLPLLRIAFPEAPLVAVRRHPLDILVSVMAHDMTHGFHCGYRLEDAAHHLAATFRLTQHYEATLGIRPHRFGYEAFVADQQGETGRLMATLDLPVDPAQLRFHESRRHAPTPSYAQVKEPLHARSVGRWRAYARHLAPILPVVAEAMAAQGYEA